jgi:hypothetical protein
VECGKFPQVILDGFNVVLYHPVRLLVQGHGARLAHFQGLQNFLYQVTALATM